MELYSPYTFLVLSLFFLGEGRYLVIFSGVLYLVLHLSYLLCSHGFRNKQFHSRVLYFLNKTVALYF